MIHFLRLIRWPNLAIIILTQYCLRIFLDFSTYPSLYIPGINFFLLTLSTVLIAAAGYVINDYFDVRSDLINKPDKVVVGHGIKRRVAMGVHITMSALGILIGFYVFYLAGKWQWGFIHLIVAGLLWFYSTNYKKQFIIGNIIVALLAAIVVIIVGIYEKGPDMKILISYAGFAFLTTLIREIIKDMEDMKGDNEVYCYTIPIVIGIPKTKKVVTIINIILISLIAYFQYFLFINGSYNNVLYVTAFIQMPLFFLFYLLYLAETSKQFHNISQLLKVAMVTGILTMVLFYFI